MRLEARPSGRPLEPVFAGLERRFYEVPDPKGPGTLVVGGALRLVRARWEGVPVELRAYAIPADPRQTVASAAAQMRWPSPRLLSIRGHEALWDAVGPRAGLLWRCEVTGLQYEALVGPLPREPFEGDVRGLGLECVHP
jgi:hypothetical protein